MVQIHPFEGLNGPIMDPFRTCHLDGVTDGVCIHQYNPLYSPLTPHHHIPPHLDGLVTPLQSPLDPPRIPGPRIPKTPRFQKIVGFSNRLKSPESTKTAHLGSQMGLIWTAICNAVTYMRMHDVIPPLRYPCMVDEGCWVLVNGMLMVVTLAKGCRIRPQMAQIATSDPTLPFWNLHFGSSRGPFSPFGRALRTISEQLVTAHTTWMGLIPIQGYWGVQ